MARSTRWLLLALVLLGGCASTPTGPRVMTLPGTGMSFERFRADETACRGYSLESVGGHTPAQAANESVVAGAVVGTAVGAVAGAALGGQSGAAVGAGLGLVGGTAVGSANAQASGFDIQRRYDQAFVQCMYAKGHKVPVRGRYASSREPVYYYLPPPGAHPPPPPPDHPPPPPPRG